MLSVAVCLGLAGCSSSPTPSTPSSTSAGSGSATGPGSATTGPAPSGCTVSDKGVPSCGVLWGLATKPPTAAGVKAVESAVGRPFDFVYRYHDLNDEIPDAAEKAQVAAGKLLHISIAARDFAAAGGAKTGWAPVAAGTFDASLTAQAKGIAALKSPVFVTFEQEANQKNKLATLGSPGDFKAAWRHVHDLYVKAGATNVSWVWVMTGSADNLDAAAQLWPGNDVVDWISWNVYNQSGCASDSINAAKLVSFEDKMKVFYDFAHTRGPSFGMDASKPMMISETGSAKYPDQPDLTAQWYAAIPGVLAKYPQIKAVGLWNSVDGTCDYQFSTLPAAVTAVASAGRESAVQSGLPLTTP
ncbi:MAG: glycosyl hydrolase family 26 [Actinomycetota bacterium]|nr:glycosyl hydrolase family 26 [Actinomycetota bacterium]